MCNRYQPGKVPVVLSSKHVRVAQCSTADERRITQDSLNLLRHFIYIILIRLVTALFISILLRWYNHVKSGHPIIEINHASALIVQLIRDADIGSIRRDRTMSHSSQRRNLNEKNFALEKIHSIMRSFELTSNVVLEPLKRIKSDKAFTWTSFQLTVSSSHRRQSMQCLRFAVLIKWAAGELYRLS